MPHHYQARDSGATGNQKPLLLSSRSKYPTIETMSDTTELKLFRHTTTAIGDQPAKTWFLLLGVNGRAVQRVIFSKDDLDPVVVSKTYIRRPESLGSAPLSAPFNHPDLAIRIVMTRMSESVGCTEGDWIQSADPEYDLLVFLMAIRREKNQRAIGKFVGELRENNLLSDNFRNTLIEMLNSVYVEEIP